MLLFYFIIDFHDDLGVFSKLVINPKTEECLVVDTPNNPLFLNTTHLF